MTQTRSMTAAPCSLVLLLLVGCARTSCIVEGALISTPDGTQPIEDLSVGAAVLTWAGGHVDQGWVVAKRRHRTRVFRRIVLTDGSHLDLTDSHLIATEEGWRPAVSLRRGQRLRTRKGLVAVREVEIRREARRVYDITVWPHENFFANSCLVHNKKSAPFHRPRDLLGAWVGQGLGGSEHFRLEFLTESEGLFASMEAGGLHLYRIPRWKLDGYSLEVTLSPVHEDEEEPLRLVGTAIQSLIHVRFLDHRGELRETIRLRPERQRDKRMTAAKRELERLRRGSAGTER